MYYNARYYDSALGRFISADTIVPSAANPQSLNRNSYVLNNPVWYTDPTGHCALGDDDQCERDEEGKVVVLADRDWAAKVRTENGFDPSNEPCTSPSGCSIGNNPNTRGNPGEPTAQQIRNADAATKVSALFNIYAYDVSVAGLVVVGAFTTGGTVIQPGGGTLAGLGEGLLTYQFFNTAESILGFASWGLTFYADNQLGNTYVHLSTGEFSVGQDTIASTASMLLGFASNEPVSDSIINAGATGYSLGRIFGTVPETPPFRGMIPLH